MTELEKIAHKYMGLKDSEKAEILVIAVKKIKSLEASLAIAEKALLEINKEEMSSQRPGGAHSRSATISFDAYNKIRNLEI